MGPVIGSLNFITMRDLFAFGRPFAFCPCDFDISQNQHQAECLNVVSTRFGDPGFSFSTMYGHTMLTYKQANNQLRHLPSLHAVVPDLVGLVGE